MMNHMMNHMMNVNVVVLFVLITATVDAVEVPPVPACPPSFFGPNCSNSLLNQMDYRPPVLDYDGDGAAFWTMKETVERALHGVMDRDCSDSQVVAAYPKSGLGANLLFISLALTKAFRMNQPLVLTGDWLYSKHDGCQTTSKGLDCYFVGNWNCGNGHSNPVPGRVSTPENFEAPDVFSSWGLFWWRSITMAFVAQPKKYVEALVALEQRKMGWPKHKQPVLAVHVRHGDWCTDVFEMNLHGGTLMPCHSFQRYLKHIRDICNKYGIRHVFLSTNDGKVVDEAKQVQGLTFMYLEMERTHFDSKWGLEEMMSAKVVDNRAVAETAILDLLIMQQCDAFVGGFKSQFARVAFSLMSARLGYIPPYSTVDNPWFAHEQLYHLFRVVPKNMDVEALTQILRDSNWNLEIAMEAVTT